MRANRRPLSDEERAERRRQDRESAQEAIELLQSSEGWQAWLASRRHFRSYSFANQCLIAMQKPTATRVAGFRVWLKLGYVVNKGEKAIRIWVPIPPSKRQLEQWQNAGAKREKKPRTYFKLGPVFDRCQVQELPPTTAASWLAGEAVLKWPAMPTAPRGRRAGRSSTPTGPGARRRRARPHAAS